MTVVDSLSHDVIHTSAVMCLSFVSVTSWVRPVRTFRWYCIFCSYSARPVPASSLASRSASPGPLPRFAPSSLAMSASAPSAAGSASGAGSAPPASARATSQAVPEHILREAARRSTKMPRPRGSVSQTPPETAPPGTAEPPPVFGLPPDLQGQGSGPLPAPETQAVPKATPPWWEAYVMQSTGSAGSAAGQPVHGTAVRGGAHAPHGRGHWLSRPA